MTQVVRCISVVTLCVISLHAPLSAQQAVDPDRPVPTSTKSPLLAGFLEYMVPWVGFAYAGDGARGTLPNLVRIGGVVLAIAGLEADGEFFLFFPTDDVELRCPTLCTVGVAAAVVGSVWAIAGAVDTATDRNALVRSAMRLSVQPSPVGGLSIGYRLPR